MGTSFRIAGVIVTPGGGGAGFSALEAQPAQIVSTTISRPKRCSCRAAGSGGIVGIVNGITPNRNCFLCILHAPRVEGTGCSERKIVSVWCCGVGTSIRPGTYSLFEEVMSRVESG